MKRNNKDFIEGIMYLAGFFLLVLCPKVFWFAGEYSFPFIDRFLPFDFLAVIQLMLILWGSFLFQIFAGIFISIKIIQKSDNPILLSIFNNYLTPGLILIFCICFDLMINRVYGEENNLREYNIFFSLTKNFIPIYLVAVVNTIRLKSQKNK